jgi:phospholipase/carboxylesterase
MTQDPIDPQALPLADTLHWPPTRGAAQQLMVMLHGGGGDASDMAPLARHLARQFPQAMLLAPQGFEPVQGPQATPLPGRQWFSLADIDDRQQIERAAAVLPRLAAWVRMAQRLSGVGPAATALVGFAQGAILALALVQRHDGLAGRVLAFAGRYAALPEVAPEHSTLHFFHGGADAVIDAAHARAAFERIGQLGGDATMDIAEGVGHEIAPALVSAALHRLTSHIPHRTWRAALGQVNPPTRCDD